jgi:YesN/AraC family two-component response regulator
MARRSLENLLQTHFPYVSVIGWAGSVRDSLRYLAEHGDEPDVIFMDVELSDGNCFEIFRSATIKAEVIMTTAYDNYAVNAFKVRSLDYLLKPIEVEDMHRALSRILEKQQASAPVPEKATPVREKFLVHMGERIVPVAVKDIAYFYAEDKQTWLVTRSSQRYMMDDLLAEARLVANKLRGISGIHVYPTQTNFMLCAISQASAAALKRYLLENHQFLIRDASNFEGLKPCHFRIAVQQPEFNDELVKAIKTFTRLENG